MSSQFSPRVSEILAYSREEAARLACSSVGPEHLLLGIMRMKEGPVIDVFHRLRLNLQSIKAELEQKVRQDEMGLPINTRELVLNEKASNILKLAVLEARTQHTTKVDEQHLLLAILHDQTANGAKQILEIKIDKDVVDPDDVEMLQDLIMTAINEVMKKVDDATNSEMGKYNIPGMGF